jgi:dipeptidyl aminopeptidase/acylaminoacyl peptidase
MDPQLRTRDIYIFDLSRGGVSTRVTFDRADEMNPVWSPAGERIAFSFTGKGPRDLYVKNANGSGDDQMLFESGDGKSVMDWSSNGDHILFNASGPVAFTAALDRGRKLMRFPPPSTTTEGIAVGGGSRINQTSPAAEIHVQSFLPCRRSAGKWRVSTGGSGYPDGDATAGALLYGPG